MMIYKYILGSILHEVHSIKEIAVCQMRLQAKGTNIKNISIPCIANCSHWKSLETNYVFGNQLVAAKPFQ